MKVLKILVTIIVVLAIIVVVGSFFLPQRSKVERSTMIAVSDTAAYNYVTDFSKFNDWSPWYEMEPTAKTDISGTVGQVGATYSWDGEEVGAGSFRIKKLEPYTAIYQELKFLKPFESTAENNFLFEKQGDSTKVTWVYDGENKGIMDKWMGLALDGMIGKDYERGLLKMKTNLEK
ncbi:SRPBCC family protein [Pedobacter cryophilus]|uniref:Polyketide cyclase n=1 Tax=Pedobacter cryophilus TaxID=2571271 RepID=A0A4U1BUN4_9SPHI|nr:SRPBCC family protein [Pedobacter cryophilus]TKB95704.1 hypothetical protein FA046_15535 [Pedobacter cryophilus]